MMPDQFGFVLLENPSIYSTPIKARKFASREGWLDPAQLGFILLENHFVKSKPIEVRKFAGREGEGVKESQFAELLNP